MIKAKTLSEKPQPHKEVIEKHLRTWHKAPKSRNLVRKIIFIDDKKFSKPIDNHLGLCYTNSVYLWVRDESILLRIFTAPKHKKRS